MRYFLQTTARFSQTRQSNHSNAMNQIKNINLPTQEVTPV